MKKITIYTDGACSGNPGPGKYVMDGLSKGWAKGWRARGWVKSDKKPALNSDLWAHLLDLCEGHTFHYNWVKGHAGHPENERCDELAVQAAAQYK